MSAAAITAADAVARAEQWVSAQLLYCQSPNHASDTIDPACPSVCNRTNNAAWDPYRSDCSGLVSWAWGLPPPGRTTYGFAPFATDITQAIAASSLAEGDAVNNSDHVMLFKAWVTAGQTATFIEEPGCSATPDYAHEFTSSVSINGTQITVAYNGMTFTAIHFAELGPSCTNGCTEMPRVGVAPAPTGSGYWIADAAGDVYPDGNAGFFGDLAGVALAEPVVGIAATPSGKGYWMVAADGGVFSFGDAGFHGSAAGMALNEPVVGIAATADGGGYWLTAGDGGVFAFGDAGFQGSAGGMTLNQPVVGIAGTPTGKGYWLVASDGGIFAYGDAGFYGSTGGMPLNKPVVGMAATATGKGYWLVGSDGGIFAYGDAGFHGSAGSMMLNQPVVGMSPTGDDGGYWLVASDGGIFTYGDAGYLGNALGSTCNGATPQQCVLGSNGCFAWQNAPACGAGQACAHGTCQATCTDACTGGSTQCSGASVQICGYYGAAPCNQWSPAQACPAGQSCANGVCASPTCTDDCEPGATECQNGALLICTGTKAGGCHTWGAPTPCMTGQTCQAGGCVTGGSASAGSSSSATSSGVSSSSASGSSSTGMKSGSSSGGSSGAGGAGGESASSGSGSGKSPGSSGGCATAPGGAPAPWAMLGSLALAALAVSRAPHRRGGRGSVAMRALHRLLLGAWLALSVCACTQEGGGHPGDEKALPAATGSAATAAARGADPSKPLAIGVTLHPYYSWTKNVLGDVPGVEVRPILPGDVDAGNYQPRPEDIRKLIDLDALVINGIGHDDFITGMLKASGNERVVVVRPNEGTPLIRSLHGGAVNSHTFISFTNAVQQTYAIERALEALRPDLAERLRGNAAGYAQRLRAIKAAAAAKIAGAKITSVVTVHDGYSYFCQEFGVEVVGVVEPSHGLVPSAAELGEMVDLIKREKIQVVLSEESFPDKLLQVLRDAGGVRVYVITHIASGEYTADKFEKEMAKNADTLVAALAGR